MSELVTQQNKSRTVRKLTKVATKKNTNGARALVKGAAPINYSLKSEYLLCFGVSYVESFTEQELF